MRLRTLDKGETVGHTLLFHFISLIAGVRLPDAARIVLYHKDFYGKAMASWTDQTMRGPSNWSVGERELLAAMVAKWNVCSFCVTAHGAMAALELGDPFVNTALQNPGKINPSGKLKQILVLLEKLVKTPESLSTMDIKRIMDQGINRKELEDAMAVTAVFSITVRCANAFDFAQLDKEDAIRMAKQMLARGYIRGKHKPSDRPNHTQMAEQLRHRILGSNGETDPILRRAIAQRINGGPPLPPAYDELVVLIDTASYKITDSHVRRLVTTMKGEKAAFEIITTAAVAAGLRYWDIGRKILMQIV